MFYHQKVARVRVFADIQNFAPRAHCVHGIPKARGLLSVGCTVQSVQCSCAPGARSQYPVLEGLGLDLHAQQWGTIHAGGGGGSMRGPSEPLRRSLRNDCMPPAGMCRPAPSQLPASPPLPSGTTCPFLPVPWLSPRSCVPARPLLKDPGGSMVGADRLNVPAIDTFSH